MPPVPAPVRTPKAPKRSSAKKKVADEYGRPVAERKEYLLLRSVPGSAKPGLYTSTWTTFSGLFPVNPKTNRRLPQKGFYYICPESDEDALQAWADQGFDGAIRGHHHFDEFASPASLASALHPAMSSRPPLREEHFIQCSLV